MDTCLPPSPQWNQPHSACLHYISEQEGWLLYTLNNAIHVVNPFSLKYHALLRSSTAARINCIASCPRSTQLQPDQQRYSSQASIGTEPPSPSPSVSTQDQIDTDLEWGAQAVGAGDGTSCSSSDFSTEKSTLESRELIASGGEDGRVVCWDIVSQSTIAVLQGTHQVSVKAVDWTMDGKYIVSGDKNGKISVWDPAANAVESKDLPGRHNVSCIKALHSSPDTVAVGTEGGDILIVSIKPSITVKLRLHGHKAKIHSLAWQPVTGSINALLASGSADQTVRVWDVDREASTQITPVPDSDNLPTNLKNKPWVPVAWTSHGDSIMSANSRGVLVRWRHDDRGSTPFIRFTKGKCHNRTVFQIMVWPGSVFAFTISMDRRMITWDVDDRLGLAQIDCLGGNVISLDIGSLDPRRIAMGCGNNMIKIWDTMSQGEPYSCQNIENLYNKVRTVKWHPAEEGRLAFGLEDGKIGFIDNLYGNHGDDQGKQGKQGKQPKKQGKKGALAWCSPKVFEAPVPELFDLSLKESSFCVMSCGSEGKILISDASRPTNRSLDLDSILRQQNQAWYQSQKTVRGIEHPVRRSFAIHHNEDLLAIGNDDGSVEVYEVKYFRLVYVYQGHKKRVESLKWNWAGDNTGEATAAAYLLASGADDGRVSIHQLDQFARTTISETHHKPNQDVLPTTQCFVTIHGHSKGISDMAWSPHCQGSAVQKLATTSYDGNVLVHQLRVDDAPSETTAQDEDTFEQAPDSTRPFTTAAKHKVIACFSKHGHAALSVHWSLTDVDRIYSGGNDWTLWNWDWKSHPDSKNSGEKRLKKKKKSATSNDREPLEAPLTETVSDHQLPHDQPEDDSVAKLLEEVAAMKEKILAGTVSTLSPEPANSLKREIEIHPTVPSSPTPSKRAKTTESPNPRPQYNPPQAETTHAKKALFPMSTAAFQVQSKQTVHLEIIRLVRNIYCRRYRHGVIVDDSEMEATRRRWKAMQEFFEKDADGVALSKALGQDLDEMNLPMDTDEVLETDVIESKAGHTLSTQPETVSKGDLIFYGSREAVIALAEMEAQEMPASNYFLPGTGFGVTQCPPVQRAAQRKLKSQPEALAQIPISYWLGDVPKMADILTSLPASELGVHDWIGIALSPMGGAEAWKDMMAKTAAKFLSRREVHAAVLCLLGIGRVYDAVDAYRSQGLFREALMLLRIRTMEDDEDNMDEEEEGGDNTHEHPTNDTSSPRDLSRLHIQILAEWGQVLDRKGLYEQACKCQLALASLLERAENRKRRQKGLSKPLIALSTLARRMDVATLRTAAGLAILLQDASQQERIDAYESAKASKEESDQIRRAAALERSTLTA
ncbi:Gem-associated protein 5 [Podila verticillata]|nr:Gem-associated protein 5 [Podila verticillata]